VRTVKGKTFAGVYGKILHQLLDDPDYITSPRGMKILEISDMIFTIENPMFNLFKNHERSVPQKYLAGELRWYFLGDNKLEYINNYSKFWSKLTDNNIINSAYGYLLFTTRDTQSGLNQWQWALQSLLKDKDSRQAIMHFNRPVHQYVGNKDFVCTLNAGFSIRDNKLNMSLMMRSTDIYFGLTFDYPFFSLLHQQMLRHLKFKYKDLQLGEYTHHSISLHAYEKDFEKLRKMANVPFSRNSLPELDIDLIDPNGNPTVEFINLDKKSKFLDWMASNL